MNALRNARRELGQSRDDTVMTPTALVELDFLGDHTEYSAFEKRARPASWEGLVAELDLLTRE